MIKKYEERLEESKLELVKDLPENDNHIGSINNMIIAYEQLIKVLKEKRDEDVYLI